VVVLLCSVGVMVRVADIRPVGFWYLWCPSTVEVGARRDGYAVQLVDVVGEGFGYAGEMAVVEVVGEGFSYAVELHTIASGGCLRSIASL
jgi:hypothetical protein